MDKFVPVDPISVFLRMCAWFVDVSLCDVLFV